ncbi:MAG: class I SAM-dependent methyltransferase [Planctomycetota bacterium]|jgi:SAM-dependent methyltransferase
MDRPAHLTQENAAAFAHAGVARAYVLRPPYPQALIDRLRKLLPAMGGRLLEAGCGTGEVARRLAPSVARVDAFDPSAAMLEVARHETGGDAANICWTQSTAEEFAPGPEGYDLIVTALSLHWMDWERVMPNFASWLRERARHAIVTDRTVREVPWRAAIEELVPRFSAMQNFEHFDLLEELQRRGLFRLESTEQFGPETARQSVDDYLESWHSRAGFARERISEAAASEFRAGIAAALQPHARDGWIEFDVTASVAIGVPLSPSPA